ncbi:alpha/beta hydrolase [Sinorhizobium sp. RAC02]|uniref:alpha/beta hydrolase n=1 Tax=Sinorhizobium sp. RAC02 TaxID=1842534 RepID=UPI00083D218C|nr:alpha/beta hydrolase [Sinorhizobium sp. RAC02]AOF92706.1 alpha/beta hydrolase fold family protein [Sinorhizobium sp. RAC02]
MNGETLLDPELRPFLLEGGGLGLNADNLASVRAMVEQSFGQLGMVGEVPRIVVVAGPVGAPPIQLRIYTPSGTGMKPAIYNIHGGGYVVGSAVSNDGLNWQLAMDTASVVVSVDYRLAPETPFPGPVEDCYAGLRWLFENASALGVDERRITIMGDSAGGGLAAAATLLARDRGAFLPSGVMLIYPMLDHRTGSDQEVQPNPTTGGFVWTAEDNRFGWTSMRGAYAVDDERAGYFSPSLAEHLDGFPPLFLAVGGLDLFLEEGVNFSLRASRAGVPVECHVYPGAAHGFDLIGDTALGRQFRFDRHAALSRWNARSV